MWLVPSESVNRSISSSRPSDPDQAAGQREIVNAIDRVRVVLNRIADFEQLTGLGLSRDLNGIAEDGEEIQAGDLQAFAAGSEISPLSRTCRRAEPRRSLDPTGCQRVGGAPVSNGCSVRRPPVRAAKRGRGVAARSQAPPLRPPDPNARGRARLSRARANP